MHFRSIKKGTIVVIRMPEGDRQGRALREEGGAWILEGDLVATPANVVRFVRGAAGKPAEGPPTTGRGSSAS